MRKNYCSNCGTPIKNEGIFCESCGKPLEDINTSNISSPYNSRIENKPDKIRYHKNKYIALFLSIIPGLGQMYNGQILKGILIPVLFFIFMIIGDYYEDTFISGPIGLTFLAIYFYNLGDAYKTANDINKNDGNYFYSHENEHHQGFYEKRMNDFQKVDTQISSYFHDKSLDGKKNVSLIKVTIIIIVLYSVLLFLTPS